MTLAQYSHLYKTCQKNGFIESKPYLDKEQFISHVDAATVARRWRSGLWIFFLRLGPSGLGLGPGRVIYDSASAIYSSIIMILSICIKSGTWLVMDFLFLKYYDMMHACLRFCNLSGT